MRTKILAAELEFDEQNAQRLPPYPQKHMQQTLDFAANAQLAGGMLLVIPPDSLDLTSAIAKLPDTTSA